jgi:hypothetical protein
MLANKLKLNDSKTELFLLASSRHANTVSNLDLKIGGSVITPSNSIKNLGIIFDNNLTMKDHVSSLCRSVNFHLRNLNRIRRFIDKSTCAHAVRSLILSRLDYGNSLLGGVSVSDVQRLQKLQNRAARLIYQVSKRTSASPFIGCRSSRELNLRFWCMCIIVSMVYLPFIYNILSKGTSQGANVLDPAKIIPALSFHQQNVLSVTSASL